MPFRAFGDGEVLLIGGNSEAWHFDGAGWSNLGSWRAGGFTYAIDMDSAGNVWVSGNGGAARRDAETGFWQRYRITNTGQMDNFLRDIAFAPNGDVWVTDNAGPGVGGIGVFDGERWHNHNVLTYGLGRGLALPDRQRRRDHLPRIDRATSPSTRCSTASASGTAAGYIDPRGGLLVRRTGRGLGGPPLDDGELLQPPLPRRDRLPRRCRSRAGARTSVRDPDRPGTVWACANLEVVRTDGNYRFSRENADFPELNPMHDVLTDGRRGSRGIAWVGSTEGLFRLDANTGTHQWWHQATPTFPDDQVTPLAVSPDGLVWFTNFNSQGVEPSLVWFDGIEFGAITRDQGLPHAQIYDAEVRAVPGGYEIWLACASRGIAVLTVPDQGPVAVDDAETPSAAPRLVKSVPNPFGSSTALSFSLENPGRVRLDIFDVTGRLVRKLVYEEMPSGSHVVSWDARDALGHEVKSGTYFYRFEALERSETGRMVLTR